MSRLITDIDLIKVFTAGVSETPNRNNVTFSVLDFLNNELIQIVVYQQFT